MASFDSLTMKELKMLAKLRIADSHESMSRQQLESIFTALFVLKPLKAKPILKFASKAKKKSPSKAKAKGNSKPESILN